METFEQLVERLGKADVWRLEKMRRYITGHTPHKGGWPGMLVSLRTRFPTAVDLPGAQDLLREHYAARERAEAEISARLDAADVQRRGTAARGRA